ncbi:MAG TPA: glycerophosphodiester phosphodiesterase family protein, partial [Iamia sp.]|nr:glycerophosphodiester phosphodiesterase family protein [Iamia sp.]
TRRAFREAIERGVPDLGLELDVHLAGEGGLVVIHDATTSRTTGDPGEVAGMTVDELARLNAASRWRPGVVDDPSLPGPPAGYHPGPDGDCGVPTLAEVLDLRRAMECDAPVTIEVKAAAAGRPLVDLLQGRDELPAGEGALVTLVAIRSRLMKDVRARMVDIDQPLRFGLAPTAIPLAWLWLRALAGWPPTGTRYARVQLPHQALRFGGARIVRNLKRSRVTAGAGAGGPVAVDVWTVDDPAVMRRMLGAEVDGIMTDRPTELRQVVTSWPAP